MFRSMWCNIRKWRNNYRVYIAFLAVAVFTYIRSDSIKNYAALKGLSVTPFFFTFQMDDSITRMLFYFGIILLLCNAPFIDEHQLFALSRLGRKKWFCGQILYILLANVIYFAWMFFVSIIVFIPWVAPSAKWGDIWINLSHNPALAGVVLHEEAVIYFSPIIACLITFLLNVSAGFIIGLIIFAANLGNNRIFGASIAAAMIVFSNLIYVFWLYKLQYMSVIHWTNIFIFMRKNNPISIIYIVTVEILVIIILITYILKKGKKCTLNVLEMI